MCGEKYFVESISQVWPITVLYGLYVALFGGSVYVLLYRRPNTFYLGSSLALFLLTTAYTGILLAGLLAAPITSSDSYISPDGVTVLPCNTPTPEGLNEALTGSCIVAAQYAIVMCISLVADGVLIYRCVVLWHQRRWIGIPPGVILLTTTALNAYYTYCQARLYIIQRDAPSGEGPPPIWTETATIMSKLVAAINTLELANNVITTALITLRIWLMARGLEKVIGKGASIRYRIAMSMM
ncbi:hypothetical protein DENSPDRAFT_885695 [Dentipellis sp. KUC8613]|nr:hypothetical protein DENSPDRAFT_885695 [Dentipellis sp. KUC8613]